MRAVNAHLNSHIDDGIVKLADTSAIDFTSISFVRESRSGRKSGSPYRTRWPREFVTAPSRRNSGHRRGNTTCRDEPGRWPLLCLRRCAATAPSDIDRPLGYPGMRVQFRAAIENDSPGARAFLTSQQSSL